MARKPVRTTFPRQLTLSLIAVLAAVGTSARILGADAPPAAPVVAAPRGPGLPLINSAAAGSEKQLTPTGSQVSVTPASETQPGLVVIVEPGKEGYPGVRIKPAEGRTWDLSAFGHVEAKITNTGATPLNIALRVDNDGDWHDNPWNTESTTIKPGATETFSVIFGYGYGRKPDYALNPKSVIGLLMFCTNVKDTKSFRIDAIEAAGPSGEKPPVDPKSVRVRPKDEIIVGAGVAMEGSTLIESKSEATGSFTPADGGGQTLHLAFPDRKDESSVSIKPVIGRWDLREDTQVRIKFKNVGQTPVTPIAKIVSDAGPTDTITAKAPIDPGAEGELVVPFQPAASWCGQPNTGDKTTWDNGVKATGTKFVSDAVGSVWISAQHTGSAALQIQSITADSPVAQIPEWLGKRPPVEGEWTQTFNDDFNGGSIDLTKWNIYGPNYWDHKSHWSKDNVILDSGMVKLRYEKKTGHQNDDPAGAESPYASGFLETYGKWVQRYGYFESRMKLPTAPGLWPGFWLMPDRGLGHGPQWKRADTGNNGMEFDIMEHLTRWGPHRFNIAMHWDGYGKTHKQLGTSGIYVQADKDGFITSGLLWLPGQAIYYCNGVEIARWEDPRVSSVESDIMFTLPMGGWDNNALDNGKLPADWVIDYVRVWQRKDLASAVDGPKPNDGGPLPPQEPAQTKPATTKPAQAQSAQTKPSEK